jgi:hypothetical protein
VIRELPYRVFVERKLDRMARLPANWDAEGAVPIDPAIIQAARDFIARLPDNLAIVPAVVPRSGGNLQFEWTDGPRSLELEIETPQTIHYLKWSPGEAIEEEGVFPIDGIGRAVLLSDWIAKGLTRV